MQNKPGVMIYFDIQETVKRLSDRSAGILFRAILEYGATKKEPTLPDSLYMLWPMIRMRLDTDDERYHQMSQRRRYAAYTRWCKHDGENPLSYNDWLSKEDNELDPA